MLFEVKNLHLLPASSVRQHRYPPWKKRSNLKFLTLKLIGHILNMLFTWKKRSNLKFLTLKLIGHILNMLFTWKKRSNLKFLTLKPAPEPRAIELVRIAEVSSR